MLNRPTILSATVLALGAIAVPLSATNSGNHGKHDRAMRDYVVTVENLTPAGSQPLSPPLVVVHDHHTRVWSPGTLASSVVAGVAEDANNGPAVAAFSSLPGVRSATTGVDVNASAAAPIGPGASQSYVVRGRPGDRLSLVSMLVNTNDGFTGLQLAAQHDLEGRLRPAVERIRQLEGGDVLGAAMEREERVVTRVRAVRSAKKRVTAALR